MITTRFKPGTREEAIRIIDKAPKEEVRGFAGIIALLHEDDPDSATVISMWDSEDALNASEKGVFQDVMRATEGLRVETTITKSARVREMREQLVPLRT